MMRRTECKTKLAFLWKILPQLAEGLYLTSNHSQVRWLTRDGDEEPLPTHPQTKGACGLLQGSYFWQWGRWWLGFDLRWFRDKMILGFRIFGAQRFGLLHGKVLLRDLGFSRLTFLALPCWCRFLYLRAPEGQGPQVSNFRRADTMCSVNRVYVCAHVRAPVCVCWGAGNERQRNKQMKEKGKGEKGRRVWERGGKKQRVEEGST